MKNSPHCYFCGSTKMYKYMSDIRHKVQDVSVYRCNRCDLVQNYPLKPKAYSSLKSSPSSSRYSRHWESFEKYEIQQQGAKQFLSEWIIKITKNYFNLDKNHLIRILEVGCHTGLLLSLLKNQKTNNLELIGLDPDRLAVEWGRKKHQIRIDKGYLKNVNYAENSFDIVILSEILEHSSEPLKLLNRVKRIIKSKGLLFIVVPDAQGMRSAEDFIIDEHMFHFTKDTLRMFASRENFVELLNIDIMIPNIKAKSFKNRLKNNKFIYYWTRKIMTISVIKFLFSVLLKPGVITAAYVSKK